VSNVTLVVGPRDARLHEQCLREALGTEKKVNIYQSDADSVSLSDYLGLLVKEHDIKDGSKRAVFRSSSTFSEIVGHINADVLIAGDDTVIMCNDIGSFLIPRKDSNQIDTLARQLLRVVAGDTDLVIGWCWDSPKKAGHPVAQWAEDMPEVLRASVKKIVAVDHNKGVITTKVLKDKGGSDGSNTCTSSCNNCNCGK